MTALRDELTALIAVAKNDLGDLSPDLLGFVRDHGPALLAALDDAERYRFIREHAGILRPKVQCVFWKDVGVDGHWANVWDGLSLDAAIDAARKP